MDETLRQLGELLLAAVPTVVLLSLIFALYRVLVHKPLVRVLEERYHLTAGALERARADIAAAAARASEYEQRLREARISIFRALEERRQRALEARSVTAAQARAAAQERVRHARAALEQQSAAARVLLEQQTESLAAAVIRTVLHPAAAAQSPAGGSQ